MVLASYYSCKYINFWIIKYFEYEKLKEQKNNLWCHDSNSPDIRFRGENSVQKGLRGHPLDREHGLATLPVVVAPIDVPRHTEVGNLGHAIGAFAAKFIETV